MDDAMGGAMGGALTLANLSLGVTEACANATCAAAEATNATLASVQYTPLQATLIGFSACLLSLVTIAGNLMVMVSFKLDKQLQTISNYFLFSLAVADMIIGAISMPLFTVYQLQGEWRLGRALCDTWLSVDYLASNASVLNLLVISFDRYFSVTRPLTYRVRRTTRKAALMIFSAWAVSAVVWPPSIVAWPYIEGNRTVEENQCYIQFIYTNEYMNIVTVMIAFFVPVSVMIGLYLRVWFETVKRQRELVHLQAGKKASSKRSDSSDETVDDSGLGASSILGRGRGGWRGANANVFRAKAKAKGDVTYVPTPVLKSKMSSNSLARERPSECRLFWSSLCSACTMEAVGDRSGVEDASSEGCVTPRSVETPVQTKSVIRDPYAAPNRPQAYLRHSASIEERGTAARSSRVSPGVPLRAGSHHSGTRPKSTSSAVDCSAGESIYTILIRFPPASASACASQTMRVPSIQMIPADESLTGKSLTSLRKLDSPDERLRAHSAGGGRVHRATNADERIGPASSTVSTGGRAVGVAKSEPPSSTSAASAVKVKKATSEKKQERKAAKTLSAILLAFIMTWTPYSVLVVLKSLLGKDVAEQLIPKLVWEVSYYLCYINSTVNPLLYALCNAAFRRTYMRILTCRWASRDRQPIVQRYYYG